jgi:hypothetical protein
VSESRNRDLNRGIVIPIAESVSESRNRFRNHEIGVGIADWVSEWRNRFGIAESEFRNRCRNRGIKV